MPDDHRTGESTVGVSAERVGRNDSIFRKANEGIRAAAAEHDVDDRVPFVCECADPSCRELIRMTLGEYEAVRTDPRQFLNAPGHEAAAWGWGEVVGRYDGHVVVAKIGRAGEVAERLEGVTDPASAPIDGDTAGGQG